jgi:hypothetical protein
MHAVGDAGGGGGHWKWRPQCGYGKRTAYMKLIERKEKIVCESYSLLKTVNS